MPYNLIENEFNEEQSLVKESIFTISNGYIGIRGSFEEGIKNCKTIPGTYINAFYDLFDINYAAKYTGYPDIYQRMVPLINIHNIEIYIDNNRIFFDKTKIQNYNINLNFKTGELTRKYRYLINDKDFIDFEFNKFLSQTNYELFFQNIKIKTNLVNQHKIKLIFPLFYKEETLDKGIPNDPRAVQKDLKSFELINSLIKENKQFIEYKTIKSNMNFIYGTEINGLEYFEVLNSKKGLAFEINCSKKEINIFKTSILYCNKFDNTNIDHGEQKLLSYTKQTYDFYLNKNKKFFEEFWKIANSSFNNEKLDKANNFNMFQLFTNIGKLPWTNIPAKGLSGEGYGGHYFWDSEIYIVTALTLLNSNLAKTMLMFRYNTLNQARQRAKIMNHKKGALFPWRTINGEETSTYYPAGTAQYHINGDISYAFINYFKSTLDYEFLFNYGLDVLVETARVWEDKISVFNNIGYINSITGPDEYQILVNNDYWTNLVAKFNLKWAFRTLEMLKAKDNALYDKKVKELNISTSEIQTWSMLEKIIYYPYDEKRNLNPQHDNFLQRKVISKEEIEGYKPLLRKLHPLSINTLQVTKQADVVLANLFFYNKESEQVMKNNWFFYENTDTSDSSLSKCIYAIMAARLKIGDYGFDFFKESLILDLQDTHKNSDRGLHLANMGSIRMFIIYGLLGINIEQNFLGINPRYNNILNSYSINIEYQKSIINFAVENKKLIIKTKSKKTITIKYGDTNYLLENEMILDI